MVIATTLPGTANAGTVTITENEETVGSVTGIASASVTSLAGTLNVTVIEETETGIATEGVVAARTMKSTQGVTVTMVDVSAGTTTTDNVDLREMRSEAKRGGGGSSVMGWARLRGGRRPHRTRHH